MIVTNKNTTIIETSEETKKMSIKELLIGNKNYELVFTHEYERKIAHKILASDIKNIYFGYYVVEDTTKGNMIVFLDNKKYIFSFNCKDKNRKRIPYVIGVSVYNDITAYLTALFVMEKRSAEHDSKIPSYYINKSNYEKDLALLHNPKKRKDYTFI